MSAPAPSWEAAVTGINWGDSEGDVWWHYRVEWGWPTPTVAAIRITGRTTPMLRLGTSVLLTSSWRGPVFDLDAMAATPWAPAHPGSSVLRAPSRGLEHPIEALSGRRRKKWPAVRAQVAGIEIGGSVHGSAGHRFDLIGVGAGAGERWSVSTPVPRHVQWFVEVGAEVTVHLDPIGHLPHRDHLIDWVGLGQERGGGGWTWRDVAPPGSVAAMLGSPR